MLAVVVGLALVVSTGACSSPAPRKPTVVVLPVKGKKGSRMSKAITKVLVAQGEYELLDPKTYRATAKELGAVKVKTKNVRKVARKIGAEVVVSGTLKRVRKKEYRLTVDVRDGRSGKRVERFKLRLKGRKLNKRARGELELELIQAMATVEIQDAPMTDGGDVVAEDRSKKKKKKAKKRDQKAAKKEKKKSKKQLRAERKAREREERERAEEEERERKRTAAEDAKRKKREEREAKREAKREKKRLAAEKKKREAEEKKRKEREAKLAAARAKKKKEAEERRRKREQAELDKVTKPETDDTGQAIDDETPGGL